MKRTLLFLGFLLLLTLAVTNAVTFYRQNLQGIPIAVLPPKQSIEQVANTTGFPLSLPKGFSVSFFTKNLENPRVMIVDPKGRKLVSIPSAGRVVALVDGNNNGTVDQSEQITIIDGLHRPHGMTFGLHQQGNVAELYVAETDQIALYDYNIDTFKASNKRKISDLPQGGNHVTRTIGIGPDNRLYVSIGSSCNACIEKDTRRAAILSMKPDGTDVKTFATGLRNSVFLRWHPVTANMWATDMGRDLLGDDLPPDEINIVEEGEHYGWPYCYGKQIHDANFDSKNTKRNFCIQETIPSHVDLPAHSAPLGLAFIPESSNWPKEYWGDLLVSYHGSWNRSVPTGYKVVRIKLDEAGKSEGVEDFISGWLEGKEALGRPVDLMFDANGDLYISDDKAGVIYVVRYNP